MAKGTGFGCVGEILISAGESFLRIFGTENAFNSTGLVLRLLGRLENSLDFKEMGEADVWLKFGEPLRRIAGVEWSM